jgi:hypothetical protein
VHYAGTLQKLEEGYSKARSYELAVTFYREAFLSGTPALPTLGFVAKAYLDALSANPVKPEAVATAKKELQDAADEIYKEYDAATDQKLITQLLTMFIAEVPADQQPPAIKEQLAIFKGDVKAYVADMYAKSFLTTPAKLKAALASGTALTLGADPAIKFGAGVREKFVLLQETLVKPTQAELAKANRYYVDGTMKMLEGRKKLYPNANSTMRMTYGKVANYKPRDGVMYDYMTTLDGMMEKEDSTNEEFIVPKKLKELYKAKDFGRYAANGTVPVGFLTDNDITGGNSGSPVLNARGELIGTAFDGNWESMSGNIAYDKDLQRTIICDIRYVLFCVEKLGGADNIINELDLVYKTIDEDKPAHQEAAPAAAPAGKPGKAKAATTHKAATSN